MMKSEKYSRTNGLIFLMATLSLLMFLISCGKPELADIEISPQDPSVVVGETVAFRATGRSEDGDEMAELTFQWSAEGDVGSVDDAGRFSATKPGEGTIIAEAAGISAKTSVAVKPKPVADIRVEPEKEYGLAGTKVRVVVKALTEEGEAAAYNEVAVSTPTTGTAVSEEMLALGEGGQADLEVTLSSDPGENRIVVQSGEVTKDVRLIGTKITQLAVLPKEKEYEVGEVIDFQSIGRDGHGNEVSVEASWTLTGDSAVLGKKGQVEMKKPGKGLIIAAYEGLKQGQAFEVVPGKLARIELTPDRAELRAGESVAFDARGFNAQGHPLEVEIQWQVDKEIGRISEDGAFFAEKAGQGTVKAVHGEVSAIAPVNVEHGSLAAIDMQIDEKKLAAGTKIELAAEGMDAFGNRFSVSPSWFLSKSIGRIDQETSTFTALKTGTGEIRAMVENLMESVEIEVVPAELADLQIAPNAVSLTAGESIRFEVKGFDRYENPVEVKPAFSIRQKLGDLDPDGQFRAVQAGNTVVVAEAAGIEAQSEVAVTPADMIEARIEPAGPVELAAGQTQQFHARGYDTYGNPVKSSLTWKVLPELGRFDPQGLFFATKTGKGAVVATVEQLSTGEVMTVRADVGVRPGETARIDIEPADLTLEAGEERVFSSVAYDKFGNETGASIHWSVGRPAVGRITDDGLFTAVKAESGNITASAEDVTARAPVKVLPSEIAFLEVVRKQVALTAGEKVELRVIQEDRFGNALDLPVLWSLSDGDLASITAEGLLTAQKEGRGTLVAAVRNIVDSTPIEVKRGPLEEIHVAPKDSVVSAGNTSVFRATGFDAGGNPIEIKPEWSASEELGSIDAGGVFSANKVGSGMVVAAADDVRGTADLRVVPGKPAVITVEPEEIELTAGESVSVSYEVFDSFDNVVPDPEVQLHVAGDLGVVTPEDEFHARKAGQGELEVVSDDARTRIPVRVHPAKVHTIQVLPEDAGMTAGQKTTFSAKGSDAYGNPVDLEPKWSVSGGIGRIDESGTFQAVKARSGYVTAQANGVTGVSRITIRPGAIVRIEIEPSEFSVAAGSRVSFRATAYDDYGNVAPAKFDWSVQGDGEIGEVIAAGTYTVKTAGKWIVTAAADDIEGRATIEVEPGPLAGIEFVSERLVLTAGEALEPKVLGHDAFGNSVRVDPRFELQPGTLGSLSQEGRVQAHQSSRGRLFAYVEDLEASVPLDVKPGAPASIEIKPPEKPIMAGKSYPFVAAGFDRQGNAVPIEPRWAVSREIGKIGYETGIFDAVKTGKGLLTCYSGDIVEQISIEVEPGELYNLFIVPNPVTVESDKLQEFTLNGVDVENNDVSVSPSAAEWQVIGNVGTMEDPGRFRGTKMGEGKVTASVGDLLAEAYVTVVPGQYDVENSRIRVTHSILPADGKTASDIIVEVQDEYFNPVKGVPVTLVSSRQGDTIVQPSETDENGKSKGQIRSSEPGASTISAVIEGEAFPDTEEVTFK